MTRGIMNFGTPIVLEDKNASCREEINQLFMIVDRKALPYVNVVSSIIRIIWYVLQ